jgi:hypothetical protein
MQIAQTVAAQKRVDLGASLFFGWLSDQATKLGYDPKGIRLWDPETAETMGCGRHWTISWEEGPFEWTMITAGCTLTGPSQGSYSTPGPFLGGLSGPGWFAEPKNNYTLCFIKD